MFYNVNEAFDIAKKYGVISNKNVFYRWLAEGVIKSTKVGRERTIHHDDLMEAVHLKLHPFVKELLTENRKLKEELKQKTN